MGLFGRRYVVGELCAVVLFGDDGALEFLVVVTVMEGPEGSREVCLL